MGDRMHTCLIRPLASTIGRVGHMRRTGKAERMPAVHAHVLGIAASPCQEANEVAGNDADGRMTELADAAGRRLLDALQERVTAEACVLLESVASHDVTDAVTEEPAQVSHLLLEVRWCRVRIARAVEEQRMPALAADVFVTAVAIGELLVIVLAEKARQRVPNVRDRSILAEVFGSASAAPAVSPRLLEDVVVHVMAPQETRQFG